jgi:hypothetical protein
MNTDELRSAQDAYRLADATYVAAAIHFATCKGRHKRRMAFAMLDIAESRRQTAMSKMRRVIEEKA